MEIKRPFWILPVIVFSQFTGTSLWFAGNAVLPEIQSLFGYGSSALAAITSSIQFGFIGGTLLFATLNISDRYSSVSVFIFSSFAAALSTILIILFIREFTLVLILRFLTGFFLAGIYPVGMKIAASWYPKGLGKALGFLVGALVLGTAFPHLLIAFGAIIPWNAVLITVSILAIFGGILLKAMVADGPSLSKASEFQPGTLIKIFSNKHFRAAAFGYFGHMWELYAFWAFVPVILSAYSEFHAISLNIPFWSFLIVASGFLGCSLGGIWSIRWGSARIAFLNLSISGTMCILSPLLFFSDPYVFIVGYILWGITVVGDSPQFSSLTAQTAPREYVGTGLTIVNSIGFAITIGSIQLCSILMAYLGPAYLLLILIPGPIFGLISMIQLLKTRIVT